MSLQDSVGIVTGASAGIGRATARALAREGAAVTVAARSEDRLETLADDVEEEYGSEVLVAPTDVRDDEQVAEMVERTVDRFGRLDVLVNNAGTGVGWRENVEELSTEDYRTLMGTNVDGVFYCTREALPHLRESQGNLVFMGSFSAKYFRPSAPIYSAAKWWLRSFAHSIEGSVGQEGVAVSLINPGSVRTEFGAEYDEANREKFEPGEAMEPERVADAVVYAAEQDMLSTVSELDLFERDNFDNFSFG